MKTRKKTQARGVKREVSSRAKKTSVEAETLRKARLESIGAVAAVLSHESRNLLGALKTCVQVLRRNPHMTSDDAELLDIIQSGANRLDEIVSQFSFFRQSMVLQPTVLELHELIDETLAALQRDERCAPAIVIQREFDPSIRHVKADRNQLRRVFWHLFLNAVQALGDGGQLRVQTKSVGRELKIAVSDTGPGIPADVLPDIFEPLFSAKTRGTGLGLTIVRRVLDKHGGEITVQSEPGRGTSFTVTLPVESKCR